MLLRMTTLYNINLWIHIVAGAVSLVTVAIPLLVKKGAKTHRRVGWVFIWAMATVAVTGFIMAAMWIGLPLYAQPVADDATAEMIARHARSVRLTGPFFLLLSFLTGFAMWGSITTLQPTRSRTTAAAFLVGILGSSLAVLGIGLWFQQVVFIVFGSVAMYGAARDLWKVNEPRPVGKERIIEHLKATLGGATAAFTAFMVQVAGRLTDSSSLKALIWVGPLVLGIGISRLFVYRIRGSATAPVRTS